MNTVVQWVHLLSAVLTIGGVVFLRFVVLPSAESLEEDTRNTLMGRVLRRFRPLLWTGIGLLLLTGLYNVWLVAVWGGFTVQKYLFVLLVKVGLVLLMFAVAFMLTVPGEAFSRLKARRKSWLTVNVVLGLLVILLSAFLRRM